MECVRVCVCVCDRQITAKSHNAKTSVDFVAYYGQGVAYTVVMRVSNGSSPLSGVAAYVPAVTYSCNVTDDHCVKHGQFVGTSLSKVYDKMSTVIVVIIIMLSSSTSCCHHHPCAIIILVLSSSSLCCHHHCHVVIVIILVLS